MNVVFVRPTKIAGTSIERALDLRQYKALEGIRKNFPQKGMVNFGHVDYSELVRVGLVSKEYDESAYKFSFVRNPYDRAVSMCFYTRRRRLADPVGGGDPSSFLTFCRTYLGRGFEPIGLYHYVGNSTYGPMSSWMKNVKMDFIGRFENIDADFAKLARRIGMKGTKLPKIRQSRHGPFDSYYCEETRDIVNKAFGEDFERFNYPILD